MGRFYTLTVSLNIERDRDIIEALEGYKRDGGNISELVRELLRQHFFINVEVSDKTMVEIIKMRRELEDSKEMIRKANEIIEKLESRIRELEEKISSKEVEVKDDRKEMIDRKVVTKEDRRVIDEWMKEFIGR